MIDPPDPPSRRPEEQMSKAERIQQEADERIHDLEEEIERLREAMSEALFAHDHGRVHESARKLRNALDGGGDDRG